MKAIVFLPASLFAICQIIFSSSAAAAEPAPVNSNSSQAAVKPARPVLASNYGKLPLSFEANQGQIDPQVKFLSRGQGYSLFLTDSAAVLALTRDGSASQKESRPTGRKGASLRTEKTKTNIIRMELAGTSKEMHVAGAEQLQGKANYLIGNDPAKWHSNVPTYAKVKYSMVYPGVDLVYYGNQRQLEYDFVVSPGANPNQVSLHFAGAKKLKLNASGDLEVIAKDGEIAFHKPVIYQMKNGERQLLDGRFTVNRDNKIGFVVGHYDPSRDLVIDPVLAYSTYWGSGIGSIAVDSAGNAYITGTTEAALPVTPVAFQENDPDVNYAAFVSKLNASGTALIYSTYLGGSGNQYGYGDVGQSIAVDSAGEVYIAGYTYSSDFPVTTGAYQLTNKAAGSAATGSTLGGTGFVTKLNAFGSGLVYSTYLGGSKGDQPSSLALDSSGNVVVAGQTYSTDFPTTKGVVQTTNMSSANGGSNLFISKMNAAGSGLIYSTYLGGSGERNVGSLYENARAVVDSGGNAFVASLTTSTDFPTTPGSFQTTSSGVQPAATLSKLNSSGSQLAYSTYFPALINGLALDRAGNAHLTGPAYPGFPVTQGAFQTVDKCTSTCEFGIAFVAEMNPTGTALVYGTYLGGTFAKSQEGDSGNALAIDASGNAYVTGRASTSDFPLTANAYQLTLGGAQWDAFLTVLNPTGTALIYSTYLGGQGNAGTAEGYALGLNGKGAVYLAGSTVNYDFPVTIGAFQTSLCLTCDFIAEFNLNENYVAEPTFSPAGKIYMSPQSVSLADATSNATIYYTTDGSTPTTTSAVYGGPIAINQTTTINAMAAANGFANSTVATATYTITPPAATPVFSPAAGTYIGTRQVTITDATPGATIYYSIAPSTTLTQYTGPITVSSTETITAVAVATGYANSALASATYTITPPSPFQFIPVTPCRVVDTRNPDGPFGGPELSAQQTREFNIPQGACNIPATATAYSLNVTVVPNAALNYLTIWPAGEGQPIVSTLNSDGRVKANAAIVPAGTNGEVSVFVTDLTQVILDINGYFLPAGRASGLAFYPVTPCRIADTRNADGPLGGPFLPATGSRSFPVQSSGCNLPATAQAYSLNVTAVPHTTLNYLTMWPTGEAQPNVSTLNASTGSVTANGAIVPTGTGGDISVFVSDAADVVLDVNGYFAPPSSGGLSLYTAAPCRVIDTRPAAFNGTMDVNIQGSPCSPPPTAEGYILNATVVPAGPLNYLTLWPDGAAQPYVSTLNADDAAITSNLAIVPTSNGSVDAFADGITNLILDLSGYFAP